MYALAYQKQQMVSFASEVGGGNGGWEGKYKGKEAQNVKAQTAAAGSACYDRQN